MPYAKKIVLHCPRGYDGRLAALVEAFIGDGVKVIAVVGPECAKIEDIIDEIVVGQGDRAVSLVTSSHPNETVADAVAFAEGLTGELEGEVQVVTL